MGSARFVYNQLLANRQELYEAYKKVKDNYIHYRDYLEKNDIDELKPSGLKKEYEWLKEVDSLALCNAELNLNCAYRNFFQNKENGYPKFKKKCHHQKYTTNNQKDSVRLDIDNKIAYIKIPKCETSIKLKNHRKIPKKHLIKSVTIEKKPNNHYYIAILVEQDNEKHLPENNRKIGVDVGIKDFAITSNGDKYDNQTFLRKSEKKLKKSTKKIIKTKKRF